MWRRRHTGHAEDATLRCLIVDDSQVFLESACLLLRREGVAVVGLASTSAEALQRAKELSPDVTLLDIDLGAENGFQVARRLERETSVPPSSVIFISTYAGEDFADLVAASPAAGFLPKSQLSVNAIRGVLQGRQGDGDR
jgi:DNA-binding NarL/FixJ family response regulator